MHPKFNYPYVLQRREEGATWKVIAKEYGSNAHSLRTSFHQWKSKRNEATPPPMASMPTVGRPNTTENWETGTAKSILYVPNEPKDFESHAELFNMDLDKWSVVTVQTNQWQGWAMNDGKPAIVDLYQIKVTWKCRPGIETLKSVVDRVVARKAPTVKKSLTVQAEGRGVLALNIPDLHLGKLCWPRETGRDPYDLGIACKTYADCITNLADRARQTLGRESPGAVLLPIGSDFLNSDGPINGKGAYTTAGTQQDEEGRWQKSFEEGLFSILDAIAVLKKRFPKTTIRIPVIPGNHDAERIFYLGVALQVEFRKDVWVEVDNEPTSRKFYDGVKDCGVPVAIMYTHGHNEKLASYPALLAHHFDLRRYASKEIHTGHLHQQRGVSFDAYREVDGLMLRQFPSLSPADSWHAQKGYVLSQRCAQSIYYNAEGYAQTIESFFPF